MHGGEAIVHPPRISSRVLRNEAADDIPGEYVPDSRGVIERFREPRQDAAENALYLRIGISRRRVRPRYEGEGTLLSLNPPPPRVYLCN